MLMNAITAEWMYSTKLRVAALVSHLNLQVKVRPETLIMRLWVSMTRSRMRKLASVSLKTSPAAKHAL